MSPREPEDVMDHPKIEAAIRTDDDFTPRITSPYLLGVYLAMNAIPDAYLLLDGPSCFPLKTPSIQGNHDWFSTLASVGGPQRCITTRAHPSTVVFSRDRMLEGMIEAVASLPTSGSIFLSARPMAALTGADYDRIGREAEGKNGKQVFTVAPKSLSSHWLGGYSETLKSIAQNLDFGTPKPKKNSVAIVGYLFDRNEGDHHANLDELRRYLRVLGLEVSTIWFSGKETADLRRVSEADRIISLPYGRRAARILGKRLDIPVLELELPFGFDATETFLRTLGRALGREEQAEGLIDEELAKTVPLLEWVVPFVFQNAQIGFLGDPVHLPGFRNVLDLIGARLAFAFLTADPGFYKLSDDSTPNTYFDPTQKVVVKSVKEQMEIHGLDLIVSSNVGTKLGSVPIFEFGYPSYFTHALVPRPFLGFQGCLTLIDSMANTIRHQQLY
jgi:nitrogenase molybdenum-iron protein alpha/beta subunit